MLQDVVSIVLWAMLSLERNEPVLQATAPLKRHRFREMQSPAELGVKSRRNTQNQMCILRGVQGSQGGTGHLFPRKSGQLNTAGSFGNPSPTVFEEYSGFGRDISKSLLVSHLSQR